MNFIGEHLFPGNLGHFLSILSLVASVLATICFFKAFRLVQQPAERQSWLRLARVAFAVETVAIVGMFAVLYSIISNHYFEYKYAWQHSSRSMQVKYLLSCFWEGQEGSFMLWSFWHCVLGWVVIGRSRRFEAPVMMVVSFAQVCLATMLLGIYFWGAKVGSSPFVLLRNEGILDKAPIFQDAVNGGIRPDYLSIIRDGQGLNALLQNYWMVIHPPILFLGFASTLIPFAYAIAGLIMKKAEPIQVEPLAQKEEIAVQKRIVPAGWGGFAGGNTAQTASVVFPNDYTSWTKPALPWALFSAAILGLGIMMGAKWAYESLNFGGYWAWDPVENASLVPWMVLVAGVHTNLIFRHSGYSLKSTYLFYILTFLLVLYSTFLTRSGVLGDTSVHAFTDLGMNFQLLAFIGVFLLPALWLYFRNQRSIPTIRREEATYSREFWMFIAALIFFLSAIVIIAKTSLPVFNKLTGLSIAPPEDPEFSHNQIQIFVAIIIGLLTAATQYLKYKNTPARPFWRSLLPSIIITAVAGLLITHYMGIHYDKKGPVFRFALYAGVFSALFAIVANASYIWTGVKGRLRLAGASVAHVGFGLVLLGILISASNRTLLSTNLTGISPLKADEKENSFENTTLIKGLETDMGRYNVTYVKDTFDAVQGKTFYEIAFKGKKDQQSFNLYPDVIPNNKNKGQEGNAANPDAKHYWNRDIFSYVTYLSDPESKAKDTAQYYKRQLAIGDTLFYGNGMWTLNNLQLNPTDQRFRFTPADTVFIADVTVISKEGNRYKARPGFRLRNNQLEMLPDTVMSQSLVFNLNKLVDAEKREVELSIKESDAILDFITLKVYEFPQINLLWIGVVITVLGFGMSMVQRIRGNNRRNAAA
jgi:cytochrome c-type biogenesis protein CcmF